VVAGTFAIAGFAFSDNAARVPETTASERTPGEVGAIIVDPLSKADGSLASNIDSGELTKPPSSRTRLFILLWRAQAISAELARTLVRQALSHLS
jgi:hypothetical protein